MKIQFIEAAMCPKWQITLGRLRFRVALPSKEIGWYRFRLKLWGFNPGLAARFFCVTWG